MVDSLAQSSSWFTVDAETYRYFFSASAQVFAALFAVVAIAYTFWIGEIRRETDQIRNKQIRLILSWLTNNGFYITKAFINDAIKINLGDSIHQNWLSNLQSLINNADDDALNKIIVKLEGLYNEKKNGKNTASVYNNIQISDEIIKSFYDLRLKATILKQKKMMTTNSIRLSAISSAIIIIISFALLWVPVHRQAVIIFSLIVFIIAIIWIAKRFVSGFSDEQSSRPLKNILQSIFTLDWIK